MHKIFLSFLLAALSVTSAKAVNGVFEARYFDDQVIDYIAETTSDRNNEIAIKYVDTNLKNMKIIGAKVSHLRTGGLENCKIWESKLLADIHDQNVPCTINIYDSTMTATFDTPVDLAFSGVYIGCFFENSNVSADPYKCPYSTPVNVPNSFFMRANYGDWYTMMHRDYGAATITVLLQGDITPNALRTSKAIGTGVGIPGGTVTQEIEVVNYGGNEIKSIGYTYEAEGVVRHDTYTLPQPLKHYLTQKQYISLPLYGFTTPGTHQVKVEIESVNGVPNVHKTRKLTFNVNVGSFTTTRRPIMEECTGTNCGWCTRGMLGMELLKAQYPDFIAAAYHTYNTSDPMYINCRPYTVLGYPTSMFDRNGTTVDPYYGSVANSVLGVKKDYEAALKISAPADIMVSSEWNEDKTELAITSKTVFANDFNDAKYKVGYIITHDNLSHPDNEAWEQKNFVTGGDDNLQMIADGSFDYQTFNHVVISADTYKGIDGSLPATIESDTDYPNTYTVSLSSLSGDLFRNPEDVHVIAILLDGDGKIANAVQAKAGEKTFVTGISDLRPAVSQEIQYFDLMGRRVVAPGHGIYIKTGDGKPIKVIK